MAISKVQDVVFATDNDADVTAVFVNTPAEGNLLIAWARVESADGGGSISGWTKAIEVPFAATSKYASIFYKIAGASETKNVTLVQAGAAAVHLAIEEWTEVTALDKTATNPNGASATSLSTGTTATTIVAAELCIAIMGLNNTVTSPSWSNSFNTEFSKPAGAILLLGGSKIISSTGTQETTASWTTSRTCGGAIATFMIPVSGPAKIKSVNSILIASVKSFNGVVSGSTKSVNGIT